MFGIVEFSISNHVVMFFLLLLTIISLILSTQIPSVDSSTDCKSSTSIWTYYPCSFIISSPSHCRQSSIRLSIDQCTNRELTFFWHFPIGNMSITLESDENQPFALYLSKISKEKRKLIKNIYQILQTKPSQEQLVDDGNNRTVIIPSNRYSQCSIKFTTTNEYIFDYGTFIRMTIITNNKDL